MPRFQHGGNHRSASPLVACSVKRTRGELTSHACAHAGIRCTTSWSTSWQPWHQSHPPLLRSCLPTCLARLGRPFWREQPPGIGLWLPGWMLLSFLPWNFPSCFKVPCKMVHAAQSSVPGCCMSHKQVAKGARLQHQPASRVGVAACRWRAAHVPLALQASAATGAKAQRGSIRALSTSHISISALPGVQHKHAPWFETRFTFPPSRNILSSLPSSVYTTASSSLRFCRQQRQQHKPQLAASALCIGLSSSSHAHNAAPRAADDGPLATRAAPPALHIPGAPARHRWLVPLACNRHAASDSAAL